MPVLCKYIQILKVDIDNGARGLEISSDLIKAVFGAHVEG